MSTPTPHLATVGALVRLTGNDALAVLHRVTTAHLAELAPGQARATLFCDFRARLLQRAVVAVTSDRAVWLVRDDAPADGLLAAVDRAVFREDVRAADAGAGRHVRVVEAGGGLAPGTLTEADGEPRRVRAGDREALEVADGPAPPRDPGGERARITALRPAHGHEIAEDFTPFEAGLAHEIHLSKGCFTGQETLMRLVTYRGVRRGLAAVAGDGLVPGVPCDLLRAGERAGRLTSACAADAGWIGLAIAALDAEVLALPDGTPVRVTARAPETRPAGLPER